MFELLLQDGQARLELGRLDVGDEPGQEAAAEAVFERGDGLGGRSEVRTTWREAP